MIKPESVHSFPKMISIMDGDKTIIPINGNKPSTISRSVVLIYKGKTFILFSLKVSDAFWKIYLIYSCAD